jgi:hypothetical protein
LFGRNNNVIDLVNNIGQQTQVYDGVDVSVTARLPARVQLQGGTSTGRIEQDLCGVVIGHPNLTISNSPYAAGAFIPETTAFCDIRPPFQTQVKLLGTYSLPWWGLEASAAFQSLPGPQITASWAAPASAVIGLGRPLSGGARTVSVQLVPPGTLYSDRLNQLDLRFGKNIRLGRYRGRPQVDLYNALNANPVYAQSNTYGSAWQRPTAILLGRMVKFGVQIDF